MKPMKKKVYEKALKPLQVQLCEMQRWVQVTGQRVVIVFEGRDTAGKGGAINAFSEVLNPRYCRIAALPKPSDRERGQWYFQRYVEHLPAAGEITLFDRSWYNRAGVEKVMGFCSEEEYRRFLRDCPVFERLLVGEGMHLYKYWFAVDQAEQEERFASRLEDPVKRWKISPIDLAARDKYDDYGKARDAMFRATHIPEAPWILVDANDQKRARLNMIADFLERLPDRKVPDEKIEMKALPKKAGVERVKGPCDRAVARY